MTPGYKTTEFWMSLAAVLVGAVMASGVLDSLGQDNAVVRIVGIIASVLGAFGYTAARGFVKAAAGNAVAAIAVANPTEPPKP
jgi:uncharacterized membrane protein YeaQ/YmgE (transglycosylase-associated protein family)